MTDINQDIVDSLMRLTRMPQCFREACVAVHHGQPVSLLGIDAPSWLMWLQDVTMRSQLAPQSIPQDLWRFQDFLTERIRDEMFTAKALLLEQGVDHVSSEQEKERECPGA